jgi:hypothetical protein
MNTQLQACDSYRIGISTAIHARGRLQSIIGSMTFEINNFYRMESGCMKKKKNVCPRSFQFVDKKENL